MGEYNTDTCFSNSPEPVKRPVCNLSETSGHRDFDDRLSLLIHSLEQDKAVSEPCPQTHFTPKYTNSACDKTSYDKASLPNAVQTVSGAFLSLWKNEVNMDTLQSLHNNNRTLYNAAVRQYINDLESGKEKVFKKMVDGIENFTFDCFNPSWRGDDLLQTYSVFPDVLKICQTMMKAYVSYYVAEVNNFLNF